MLKLNMSMLVAASIASASAFAAYGPAPAASSSAASNWTLGFGYGQMFGMKKTSNGTSSPTDHKVDKPTLFEVDLFNSKGFGAVYMTSAKKKGVIIGTATATTTEYSFDAYMLGYQKAFANNMTWRLALGLSDQKHVDGATITKSGSEFAYAASAAYHMSLSGKLSGFVETGYIGLKDWAYDTTNKVSASGFYAKIGAKMPL